MFTLRTSARLLNRNFLHTSRTNFNVNPGSENKIIEELQRTNLKLEDISYDTQMIVRGIAVLFGSFIGLSIKVKILECSSYNNI